METLERMIAYAVRAGRFRAAARNYPDAATTFRAAADVNSAKAATLAGQIAMGTATAIASPRRAQ
jgi:hypothetical protein